jgi:hypothetical protein
MREMPVAALTTTVELEPQKNQSRWFPQVELLAALGLP